MNKVERNRAEIFSYLLWLFLPLFLFWKQITTFVHGGYAYHDLNPVDFLLVLIATLMICYPVIETYWAYRNPFAKIENGFLVICPRPFKKEIITISDVKKVRESLTHGTQRIFGFNSEYTTWVLMVDLLNSMTITIPLDQKKRESLIALFADNDIVVDSDRKV